MQINANSTGPGAQNKDFLFRVWILEIVNPGISLLSRGLSVNSTVLVTPYPEHII